MRSIYNGRGTNGTSLHTVRYFDGKRIREVEVFTLSGIICWTEKTIPGALENGMKYNTTLRRIAAIEKEAEK